MRKKTNQDNDEGVADWIVTYGDVMALLLTFFVLLFSFSTIDAQKWKEIVLSFSGKPAAIQFPEDTEPSIIDIDDSDGVDASIVEEDEEIEKIDDEEGDEILGEEDEQTNKLMIEEEEKFQSMYEELDEYSKNNNLNVEFDVIKMTNTVILRLKDDLLFNSGEAKLDIKSQEALTNIAKVVLNYQHIISKIQVEGNTDDVPINNSEYKDNFDLSLNRAYVVLSYLKNNIKIPPYKLVAVGYGEYNPIAKNNTSSNRALNRRTDIVLWRKSSVDD